MDILLEVLRSLQITLPKLRPEREYFFNLVEVHLMKLTEIDTSVTLAAAVGIDAFPWGAGHGTLR